MSLEAARRFVDRLKRDDDFRRRVLATDDLEARLATIRAEGFDCTADEIAEEGRLLDTEDLAGISSGDKPPGPLCEGGIGGLRECE